jgi:hypothetical protein
MRLRTCAQGTGTRDSSRQARNLWAAKDICPTTDSYRRPPRGADGPRSGPATVRPDGGSLLQRGTPADPAAPDHATAVNGTPILTPWRHSVSTPGQYSRAADNHFQRPPCAPHHNVSAWRPRTSADGGPLKGQPGSSPYHHPRYRSSPAQGSAGVLAGP